MYQQFQDKYFFIWSAAIFKKKLQRETDLWQSFLFNWWEKCSFVLICTVSWIIFFTGMNVAWCRKTWKWSKFTIKSPFYIHVLINMIHWILNIDCTCTFNVFVLLVLIGIPCNTLFTIVFFKTYSNRHLGNWIRFIEISNSLKQEYNFTSRLIS